MVEFREVLLDVWRAACRHIEIEQSTATIAQLLLQQLPLAGIAIRRCDPGQRSLETAAVGRGEAASHQLPPRTLCSPSQWKRLVRWADLGEIWHAVSSDDSLDRHVILPADFKGDALAGPLREGERFSGMFIMLGQPRYIFTPRDQQITQLLLEPLSVALENDRRLLELAALREAAEADRRSLLNRLGQQELHEEVVGADTGLRHVMERVELVAQADVPVLILGETGTGKEVVSRAIHNRSPRAAGPFIRVNCGAIPSELIDSHLFGHEKGSFTGAAEQRPGWFERANGGTLFLDEIGELPLPAQVRLLRVLQDHQVERVGGTHSIHVDVRVVAATHRDLSAMVKNQTFREDLWYRINVFPIMLPRLRDRMQDIPALARHFALRAARRFGLSSVEPGPNELQMLMNYHWPGNIRELGAVIDRASILGNGKTLEVAQALGFGQRTPTTPLDEPVYYEVIPESFPLQSPSLADIASLDIAMKHHIERTLVATRGKVEGSGGAAEILDINPHTLRARMRKLRIDWSRYRAS